MSAGQICGTHWWKMTFCWKNFCLGNKNKLLKNWSWLIDYEMIRHKFHVINFLWHEVCVLLSTCILHDGRSNWNALHKKYDDELTRFKLCRAATGWTHHCPNILKWLSIIFVDSSIVCLMNVCKRREEDLMNIGAPTVQRAPFWTNTGKSER